jgi:ADP-heptose:LPS heptosyltransferase
MNITKELVILRLSSLGDVAMLVPVLCSFHAQYPQTRLKIISRERFRPLFLDLDFIDFVGIDKDRKQLNFLNLVRFYFDFRPKKNLIILDCHDVLRTKILCFLFRLNGNQTYKIDKGRAAKNTLIRLEPKIVNQLKNTHERYQNVFQLSGFDFPLLETISLNKSEKRSKSKIWIGIAPFAKHSSKQYSSQNWREVILSLNTLHSDIKFFIFGAGKNEKQVAIDTFRGIENLELVINTFSFTEELKLISNLDLMLSMDSGNGHLAANFGIPVITLWGSTHPCLGFTPYGQLSSNSLFPDKHKYPFLPVSIFGKAVNKDYERAIDSIDKKEIVDLIIWNINKFKLRPNDR